MGSVAIIGIDGLSWSVLAKYLPYLPSIRRLLSSSVRGSLLCEPPITPPSWTSIFTGVPPEKHKVLGFTKYVKRGLKLDHSLYTAADVKFPRISEILAFHDLSSVLVNCILSYPPSAWYNKKHVIVYDILSPREFIYPKRFSHYLKYFRYPTLASKAGSADLLGEWAGLVRRRSEGAIKLVEEIDPDLLISMVSETDAAMHRVPPIASGKFVAGYLKILEAVDELVDFAMKKFALVMLVSDHGLRLFSEAVNVQLLFRHQECGSRFYGKSLKHLMISSAATSSVWKWVGYGALSSMKTYRLFYKFRYMVQKNKMNLSQHVQSDVYFDLVDASDACMVYFTDSRERDRILKLALDTFGEFLRNVKKMDVGGIPSFMIVPKDRYYLSTDPIYRSSDAKIIYFPSARHEPIGIFALWRRGFGASNYVGVMNNFDLLPTLLSYLELPLPSYTIECPIIEPQQQKRIDYRRHLSALKIIGTVRSRLK